MYANAIKLNRSLRRRVQEHIDLEDCAIVWNLSRQRSQRDSPIYPCPTCHQGELYRLELMDAHGCNHCGNLVELDLQAQIARSLSTAPALSYHWQRDRWLPTYRRDLRLNGLAIVSLITFTVLPTAIAALAVYIFPPLVGSRGAWVPYVWVISVGAAHCISALWLLAECYQWPWRSARNSGVGESVNIGNWGN